MLRRNLAEKPFAQKHSVAVLDFLLAVALGANRHLRPVDADLDVLLAGAGNLGGNDVGVILLCDVEGDARRAFVGGDATGRTKKPLNRSSNAIPKGSRRTTLTMVFSFPI
ncbi:MAG: hypothetical protein WDN04_10640 [Rhodospirillales bacterium]